MRCIRVHFDNGDSVDTRINGSIQTIVDYYIDRKFPFEDEYGREIMATARCVEFLDDTRIPFNNHPVTVDRIYSLSPSYMMHHDIFYPVRVEFTTHYPTGTAMRQRCAYHPGMFAPN